MRYVDIVLRMGEEIQYYIKDGSVVLHLSERVAEEVGRDILYKLGDKEEGEEDETD